MKLYLIVLLLSLLSTEVFAQCSGGGGRSGIGFGWGRSTRIRTSKRAVPDTTAKRFTNWEVDTATVYMGLLTSVAYRSTTFKIFENQLFNQSNMNIYFFSMGRNIGRFIDIGGQIGMNVPMPSTIFQDSSTRISTNISGLLNFNMRFFLWQKHRSRVYVLGEAELQSLDVEIHRKYNTTTSGRWLDFLRQTPNKGTLNYNEMTTAMLQTERDYIPLTNWTGAWNIGIGHDYILSKKNNMMLRTSIGLSKSWGLLQNTWGYKYCEECKETKKVIRLEYNVKGLPFTLPTATTLFFKLELVFIGIKNAKTKRED